MFKCLANPQLRTTDLYLYLQFMIGCRGDLKIYVVLELYYFLQGVHEQKKVAKHSLAAGNLLPIFFVKLPI